MKAYLSRRRGAISGPSSARPIAIPRTRRGAISLSPSPSPSPIAIPVSRRRSAIASSEAKPFAFTKPFKFTPPTVANEYPYFEGAVDYTGSGLRRRITRKRKY